MEKEGEEEKEKKKKESTKYAFRNILTSVAIVNVCWLGPFAFIIYHILVYGYQEHIRSRLAQFPRLRVFASEGCRCRWTRPLLQCNGPGLL